eukprot:8068087-Heterocapsa_arctica.AAC.1
MGHVEAAHGPRGPARRPRHPAPGCHPEVPHLRDRRRRRLGLHVLERGRGGRGRPAAPVAVGPG